MTDETSPRASSGPWLLIGFGIRVCLWLLHLGYAMFTYTVAPTIERFVLDRGLAVPVSIVLAWRVSHLINVYFVLFALLVLIDGAGTLVMAITPVARGVSQTWSSLMWGVPCFFAATILLGTGLGALQVLVNLAR
jgi:hypothetical protein